MRVLWVSPTGTGLDVARRVQKAGHNVVVLGVPSELPAVDKASAYTFASAADLVVVDGTHPVVRTRRANGRTGRSWKPSNESLFFDELRRKHDIVALGPTPTIDLLVGDVRYLRKWCQRLGIPFGATEGDRWASGAWFRGNDIMPPGPYLESWKPIFKAVGFRGWFELLGTLTPNGPVVSAVRAQWPPEAIPEGREAEFLKQYIS